MSERELNSNSLWFRVGMIFAFLGAFMMFIDRSIEYAVESLSFYTRPVSVIGILLMLLGLIILVMTTIEFNYKFIKEKQQENENAKDRMD